MYTQIEYNKKFSLFCHHNAHPSKFMKKNRNHFSSQSISSISLHFLFDGGQSAREFDYLLPKHDNAHTHLINAAWEQKLWRKYFS